MKEEKKEDVCRINKISNDVCLLGVNALDASVSMSINTTLFNAHDNYSFTGNFVYLSINSH